MRYRQAAWTLPVAIIAITSWIFIPRGRGEVQTDSATPAVVDDHGILRVPEKSPLRSRLQVQVVNTTATTHDIDIPGQVDANPALTVNILPPLTGRITDLKVRLGDQVSKGQLLATIASGDMAQAQADLSKARDALDLARRIRDRTREVGTVGAAATKDIESADSGVTQAQAEMTRAQSRLASFGVAAADLHGARVLSLTAPCDGKVSALNVGNGAFVDDPTATLMTITDTHSVYVTAYVPENQIGAIRTGEPADIVLPAYPGQVLHSEVRSVSNVMAADTRRLPVRLVFDNPDGHLIPNMYADVTFKVSLPAQVAIPQSALLMNNDSTTVFVEVAPWAFVRRSVEIGYDEGSQVRVLSGLKPGDRVLVKGGVLIND